MKPPVELGAPFAFITGSRAYGIPTASSDLDLVIRCDEDTRRELVSALVEDDIDVDYGDGVAQFKVGALNLIMCTSDATFRAWALGTAALQAEAPVTRSRAVSLFKALGVGGLPEREPMVTPLLSEKATC